MPPCWRNSIWAGGFAKKKESCRDCRTFQDLESNLEMNIPFATGLCSEWAGTCKQ